MKATFCSLMMLLALPLVGIADEQEWRFRVYLDDKEIGYHEFRVREEDGRRLMTTEASFEYKLLFLTLYEYAHENTEIWNGDCLTEIRSRTDANGEPYEVEGGLADDRFVLESSNGPSELPRCVMSFAYWNPNFLKQRYLLNSQNGELLDVDVSEPERVEFEVRGVPREALRYRLEAEELGIDLWYSEEQEWLGLQADAAGGRKLRYELM